MTVKTTGWPPAKRARVALRTKMQKPWRWSTGPRTLTGKRRAAQNAYKHGRFSYRYKCAYKRFSMLLNVQKHRLNAPILGKSPSKTLCFAAPTLYSARL